MPSYVTTFTSSCWNLVRRRSVGTPFVANSVTRYSSSLPPSRMSNQLSVSYPWQRMTLLSWRNRLSRRDGFPPAGHSSRNYEETTEALRRQLQLINFSRLISKGAETHRLPAPPGIEQHPTTVTWIIQRDTLYRLHDSSLPATTERHSTMRSKPCSVKCGHWSYHPRANSLPQWELASQYRASEEHLS